MSPRGSRRPQHHLVVVAAESETRRRVSGAQGCIALLCPPLPFGRFLSDEQVWAVPFQFGTVIIMAAYTNLVFVEADHVKSAAWTGPRQRSGVTPSPAWFQTCRCRGTHIAAGTSHVSARRPISAARRHRPHPRRPATWRTWPWLLRGRGYRAVLPNTARRGLSGMVRRRG